MNFTEGMREIRRRNAEHLAEVEASVREREGEAGVERLKTIFATPPPKGWEDVKRHFTDE